MSTTWSWVARANSLRFNITLTQGTPSTSSSDFGASKVTCKIQVSSDSPYSYNYGHKFIVKLIDQNSNNATETLMNWDDNTISYDLPISAGVTVLNKTSSRKFVRSSDGYLKVQLTINWAQYQTGYSGNYSNIFTGDYSAMYSACSAPTSVTANVSLQKPGGDVTISWSGASGGTNNSISKYKVYYRIGSNTTTYPTTSTYDSVTEATSNSATITLPSGNRGKYLVFKVQAIGTQSSYSSGISSASCNVKVNSLPTTPTVKIGSSTATSRTISSTASVTLAASDSTDDDTSQTISYQYKIDSGSWTSGSSYTFSTSTLSEGSAKTIYFRASDGLETSSASTGITITRNAKPSITNFTASNISSYTANGLTSFTKSLKLNLTTSKSSGTIYIQTYIDSRNTSINSLTGTSPAWSNAKGWTNYKSISISSTSNSVEYTLYSVINSMVSGGYANKDYRIYFRAVYNDGIENSSNTSNLGYYYVSGYPIFKNSYNQFADSNISGTTTSPLNFYNKIRIITYYDGSIEGNPSATFSSSDAAISISKTDDSTNNKTTYDITFTKTPSAGTTGSINIVLSSSVITKTISVSDLKETLIPSWTEDSFTFGASTIKMFEVTSSATYAATLGWPFGSYSSYSAAYSTYNMSSTIGDGIKLKLTYSGHSKECSLSSITNAKTSDLLSGTVTISNLFSWDSDSLKSYIGDYAGEKTLTIQYIFKNLFGQIVPGPTETITFDFNTPFEIADSDIQIGFLNNSTFIPLGITTTVSSKSRLFYLQEGTSLCLRLFNLKRYTRENITVNIFLRRSTETLSGNRLLRTANASATDSNCGKNYSGESNNYGTTNISDNSFKEIGVLDSDAYIFTVVLAGTTKTLTKTLTINAIKRTASNTSLTTCEFVSDSSNGQWHFQSVQSTGFGNSIPTGATVTYQLCKVVNNTYTAVSGNFTSSSGSISSTISPDWSSCAIVIKTLITLTSDFSSSANTDNHLTKSSTYTYYSNVIVVYQSAPTISYRAHQIGINASSGDLDTHAVIIKNATNRQGVAFKGAYSNIGEVLISDETDTTKILIQGFIIDGGELT